MTEEIECPSCEGAGFLWIWPCVDCEGEGYARRLKNDKFTSAFKSILHPRLPKLVPDQIVQFLKVSFNFLSRVRRAGFNWADIVYRIESEPPQLSLDFFPPKGKFSCRHFFWNFREFFGRRNRTRSNHIFRATNCIRIINFQTCLADNRIRVRVVHKYVERVFDCVFMQLKKSCSLIPERLRCSRVSHPTTQNSCRTCDKGFPLDFNMRRWAIQASRKPNPKANHKSPNTNFKEFVIPLHFSPPDYSIAPTIAKVEGANNA